MLYSGIDLHKRTLAIHTVDAAGTVVRKVDLPTNRAAGTAYFAALDGPHQAVCECTSMWYGGRDLLVPQGIDLRLTHAKYLKAISYAKVTTDAVNAATMAQLLHVQLIPEAMIPEGTREVRDLLRARLPPRRSSPAMPAGHRRDAGEVPRGDRGRTTGAPALTRRTAVRPA